MRYCYVSRARNVVTFIGLTVSKLILVRQIADPRGEGACTCLERVYFRITPTQLVSTGRPFHLNLSSLSREGEEENLR